MGRGYSGQASFEFPIYREKDGEEEEIILQATGRSYFAPGVYHALPENCYPDEGDTEIISLIDPDGNDWQDQLTEKEKNNLIEQIDNAVQEGDDADPPDYDDYEDDYDDDYE